MEFRIRIHNYRIYSNKCHTVVVMILCYLVVLEGLLYHIMASILQCVPL